MEASRASNTTDLSSPLRMKVPNLTFAESRLRTLLNEGDLLFIADDRFLYRYVADITQSWTSHVGIAFLDIQGDWEIWTSGLPAVTRTPLKKYLQKTSRTHFGLKRLADPLSPEQLTTLKQVAKTRLGNLKDFSFSLDSNRQFCSKYVYETYQDALGIELGEIETFRQIAEGRSENELWFWRLWFLGPIPWKYRTISPASIYRDSKLQLIVESC